ncbi:MAG: DNA primase [Chloroflexi bacterium]|nr:DNA primase [Chloroflexota bacterium]
MDAVTEIKRRIDPAEYIGRSVKLQKAGRNLRALCPFHTEKTPSFYVFTDRGSWRCFGSCGEGGDIFSFVQKRENVDFREALRILAEEAGVELSARAAEQRTRAEQLSGIVSAAVDFYEQQLAGAGGAEARAYLTETRGLDAETIGRFHLGWAPDEWRLLRDYLLGRGYSDEDALAAGVLHESDSGGAPYDRFRGRVIIPIADDRGVFVGLGGRILGDGEPKYLNSPQSDIFDKGRTLYALDVAGPQARETGTVVVVEGYLDVIGPWQAGFRNLVATMGTSLTEQHAARLTRFASRVVLAMDPDSAGMAAAERAGSLLLNFDSPESMGAAQRSAEAITANVDLDLRVAPLPAGKDPDDLTREDPEAWRTAIDNATPFTEFLLARLIAARRGDSAVDVGRIIDQLTPVLLAVRNPVEQSANAQKAARQLGVSERAILDRVRSQRRRPQARPEPESTRDRATLEEHLLATLLRHPGLRADLRNYPLPGLFWDTLQREIAERWLHDELEAIQGSDGDDEAEPVANRLRQIGALRGPQLSDSDARQRALDLMNFILRERLREHHSAGAEGLAEAERELGAQAVVQAAYEAWLGGSPSTEMLELAQVAIEQLQLGLSIHRRDRAAS